MKNRVLGSFIVLAAGCSGVDTSLSIENVAAPEDSMACEFDAASEKIWIETQFDSNPVQVGQTVVVGGMPVFVARQPVHRLNLRVRNFMQAESVPFEEDSPREVFTYPNAVSAVRFDATWECESRGLAPDLQPLILPQFSPKDPFCVDRREDVVGDFKGSDVIPASGPSIPAGGIGFASITPVPLELGEAFDEVFDFARLANACCQNVGGGDCSRVGMAFTPGAADECNQLQNAFQRVAPQGELDVRDVQDLTGWAAFSRYDGVSGSGFPLRLRGVLEGLTSTGDLVTSSELVHVISICRDCGGTPCASL